MPINNKSLSINEVIRLSEKAQRGDQEALTMLLYETRIQGLIANKRLKRLAKAGMENQPYRRTMYYLQSELGTDYFTTSKKRLSSDLDLLEQQLKQIITFNKQKSSTVGGYRKVRNETIERIRSAGIDIPKGVEDEFMTFLDSGAFKGIVEYDSGDTFEKAAHMFKQGLKVKDLKKEWDAYLDGQYQDEMEAFEAVERNLNKKKSRRRR